MSARFFDTVPGHAIGLAGNCVVDLYASEPDPTHLDVVTQVFAAAGKPVANLLVLSGAALKAPSDEFREKAHRFLQERASAISCRATVIEVTGLLGATARAVMVGLSLAEGTRFPMKTFNDVDTALSWITARDPTVSLPEVKEALQAVRQRAGG